VSRIRKPTSPTLTAATYAASRVQFLRRWSRSLILDDGCRPIIPVAVIAFEPELVERVELVRKKAGARFAAEMIRGEING
jgi:hypothetical protein